MKDNTMSCNIYEDHAAVGTATAGGFALAIFLSYVPQQVTIVRRQTVEGINPYFLMLMNLGSAFSFGNILMLSRPLAACCVSSLSGFDCFSSYMSLAQLFAGFLGPSILLALAVRFRRSGEEGNAVLRSAKLVGAIDLLIFSLVLICRDESTVHQLATIFGLLALGVGFVQYFPQMVTTYRLKHTGSLSVTMMLLQIPGGYLWCLSLAMRKDSHWSTWISLFAAASFQLILLIMAMYYSCITTAQVADRMAVPAPRTLNTQPTRSSRTPSPPSEASPLLGQ